MRETITFETYKKRFIAGTLGDKKYFLPTFQGDKEVTGIRSFSDGDWVVCGKDNGGFGMSYCIHAGTILIVK